MIGTHADSLIAEAIRKGFKGFDYKVAYEAVYKDASTRRMAIRRDGGSTGSRCSYEARAGLTYAKSLGYIPADKVSESASSTLEESYVTTPWRR